MILFIRKILSDLFGRKQAEEISILYGGSVDQKNIDGLVRGSGADGYLVGGASLRAKDFAAIVRAR
jgi:triosephosphate isomerase (TIM)